MMTLAAWIAVALAALILAGLFYQRLGLRRDSQLFPPPGRMIGIGGRRLHLYELGSGGPAVILESGISATSLNWRHIQQAIAGFTRAVAYDRGGLGWSDPCGTPRTPSDIARELRTLLRAAGVRPPYVLVAHSFGALVVRRFALLYPREVAGLVLVDPLQPGQWAPLSPHQRRMLALGRRLCRRAAWLAHVGLVRLAVVSFKAGSRLLPVAIDKVAGIRGSSVMNRLIGEVGKMPREVWPIVTAHWSDPKSFHGIGAHLEALPAGAGEMLDAPPIQGIPVTVLTAGRDSPVSEDSIRAVSADARHIVAHESGHWIHLDQPALVIDAVRQIVEQARPLTSRV
ncbi:MAG: alpha/beta hydrolase [Bryobacteraceae bacterium]|jgi:pimeloyl-ACP methyl ester carboxylesterase